MPTKVYPSGSNVIVDQTGQPLLTILKERAKYVIIQPTVSVDGITPPVAFTIQFIDIFNGDIRTESIANVQDSTGASFASQILLEKYLRFIPHTSTTLLVEQPTVHTKYADSMSVDAFGRARVSSTGQRLDVEFIYNKQEEIFDEVLIGAATVTHNANSRDLTLAINSAVNADSAVMMSYPVPYTPGNSQLVAMTGTINESSLIGGGVEIFMRSNVTGSVVDTAYLQSDWNINTVDNVEWDTSQIFIMDFQSLKVGRIRFGLDRGGVIIPVHSIKNDNIRSTGFWQLPTLPISWRIYNDATNTYCEVCYGDESNGIGFRYKITVDATAQLRAICATVKSEGGKDLVDLTGFNRTAHMGSSRATVGNSLIPIISIRPKATYNSITSNGLVIPISFSVDSDNPIQLIVVHDGVLTGAAWNDVDTTESIQEIDITASSLANGHEVYCDYFGTGKNQSNSAGGILGKTLLWDRKGTETGVFTICAIRTTNTSADVLISINSKEIR